MSTGQDATWRVVSTALNTRRAERARGRAFASVIRAPRPGRRSSADATGYDHAACVEAAHTCVLVGNKAACDPCYARCEEGSEELALCTFVDVECEKATSVCACYRDLCTSSDGFAQEWTCEACLIDCEPESIPYAECKEASP